MLPPFAIWRPFYDRGVISRWIRWLYVTWTHFPHVEPWWASKTDTCWRKPGGWVWEFDPKAWNILLIVGKCLGLKIDITRCCFWKLLRYFYQHGDILLPPTLEMYNIVFWFTLCKHSRTNPISGSPCWNSLEGLPSSATVWKPTPRGTPGPGASSCLSHCRGQATRRGLGFWNQPSSHASSNFVYTEYIFKYQFSYFR
jgi:hypothetical protein